MKKKIVKTWPLSSKGPSNTSTTVKNCSANIYALIFCGVLGGLRLGAYFDAAYGELKIEFLTDMIGHQRVEVLRAQTRNLGNHLYDCIPKIFFLPVSLHPSR